MSKIKQVLEIARDSLKNAKGDTLPKEDIVTTLDQLVETVPQAAAMDENQLDIMVLYMNHLSAKMDLLFNATVLCGLGVSNDLKVRAHIKDMESKFRFLQDKFSLDLKGIIDPENKPDISGAKEAAAKNMQSDEDPRK